MIQTIIESNALLYVIAAVGILGILCQFAASRRYQRLTREMSDAQTGKKDFMKQLRFKFRTDRKRSSEHMNISVFVRRQICDYRFWHMTLHQWKRLAAGCFIAGMAAAVAGLIFCIRGEFPDIYIQNILWTAAGTAAASVLAVLWTDLPYKESYLQIRLEDYLWHSGEALNFQEAELDEPAAEAEKAKLKVPSVIGMHRKERRQEETRAQREKRELKSNLAKVKSGMRETAAESERERNRELLRQMDAQEQERIIRDVLAEFLA